MASLRLELEGTDPLLIENFLEEVWTMPESDWELASVGSLVCQLVGARVMAVKDSRLELKQMPSLSHQVCHTI